MWICKLSLSKLLDHQENKEKRESAEKKIQEEKIAQEQREKEIVELQAKIEHFLQIKRTLEVHVNKHRIYEVRRRRNKVADRIQLFQEQFKFNPNWSICIL